MRVMAAKDGVLIRRRLRIFAAAVALVLLCAVCVGGVSGAVTTWEELNSAISETPVGGSVEIIIGDGTTSSIQIYIDGPDKQINIVGKTVTIKNHPNVDVVFMKSGNHNDLSIFEIYDSGSLTLNGRNPGSITLDRTGTLLEEFSTPYGPGVVVLSGGAFVMDGDVTIKNQRVSGSAEAAGVHVKSGGSFIMNGGSIVNNYATKISWSGFSGNQAGGVFIEAGATFEMSGESNISGNEVFIIFNWGGSEANFGGAGQYYTICFDQNDGTGTKYYQLIPMNENTALTLNTYECEGHIFKHWATKESGSGDIYADGATVKNLVNSAGRTITLYAQWIKESYTLEFDTNGGIPIIDSITASYGDSIVVPDVTKIGCEFTGWLDDEGNLFTSLYTMPDCGENGATKRITAQWLSTVQYTISIPEIITVNTDDQSAKISANIVSLPEGVNLNVVLSDKAMLEHVDLPSYGLEYVLYADGVSVNNDNSVAEFSLSNTASVTLTAKLAEGVNPKYSGTYIDTVKFTVLVDETGNT